MGSSAGTTGPAALPSAVEVLVVGGGQAGLAAGHHLARRGLDFVILEAAPRIGDSWRQRWDSLRLFTPASVSALPGLELDAATAYPHKDEVADYLERYAAHLALPVHLDSPLLALTREPDGFTARIGLGDGGARVVRAHHVVVATGAHARPRVPAFAADLDPDVVQLTSATYRRPAQLPVGPVLVVGAGNSGAEIATDLAERGDGDRPVVLSGRDVGRIPQLGAPVFRAMRRIPTCAGPGRLIARAARGAGGDPLGRVDPRGFTAAGIRRTTRIGGTVDGLPVTTEGERLEVRVVIWCTGADPDHGRFPVVSDVAEDEPGHPGRGALHVLGRPYQRTLASHLLGGVGLDGAHLARQLARTPRRH